MSRHLKFNRQKKTAIFLLLFLTLGFSTASRAEAGMVRMMPSSLSYGLQSWWQYEEGSGTNAVDSSGLGKNGTLSGGATWGPGKVGKAITFNGTNGQMIRSSFLTPGATQSISLWMKPDATGGSGYFVLFTNFNCARGITYAPSTGKFGVAVNADFAFTDSGTATIQNGVWSHVVVVFDGSKSLVSLYINGKFGYSVSRSVTAESGVMDVFVGSNGACGGSFYHKGSIDDVRMYNRVLSAAEIEKLYYLGNFRVQAQTNIANQVAPSLASGLFSYLTFNGKDSTITNALDASGNGRSGSLNNLQAKIGKIGQAYYFNGTSGYISMNSAFNSFGTQLNTTHSISMWINTNNVTSAFKYIMGSINDGANTGFNITLNDNNADGDVNANGIRYWIREDGNTAACVAGATNTSLQNNQWHLLTFVRNSDSTISIYIDGVAQSVTLTDGVGVGVGSCSAVDNLSTFGYQMSIGSVNTRGTLETAYYIGRLDDIRFYSRALSAQEVKLLYDSGNFRVQVQTNITNKVAPSLASGLVGYWSFDGKDMAGATAYDRSGNSNNGALTGTAKVVGKIGQALKFDGNSGVTVLDNSVLVPANVTVSAWVKRNGAQAAWAMIVDKHGSNNGYQLYFYNTTNNLGMFVKPTDINSGWVVPDGIWTHVVGTYDGTNVRMYGNGVLRSTTAAAGPISPETFNLGIGTSSFKGLIDDVRIYNRALSAQEVYTLYRLGQ